MFRATLGLIGIATVLANAACDTTLAPAIGGIGGNTSTDSTGRAAIVVSPGTLNVAVGSSFQLSTNAPVALQPLLQWSSLDQTIASVSPSGSVFGQAAGTTRILARYSDDTTNVGSATVTVVGTGNTGDRIP